MPADDLIKTKHVVDSKIMVIYIRFIRTKIILFSIYGVLCLSFICSAFFTLFLMRKFIALLITSKLNAFLSFVHNY
jgi:hypothetical protein